MNEYRTKNNRTAGPKEKGCPILVDILVIRNTASRSGWLDKLAVSLLANLEFLGAQRLGELDLQLAGVLDVLYLARKRGVSEFEVLFGERKRCLAVFNLQLPMHTTDDTLGRAVGMDIEIASVALWTYARLA